MAYVTGTATNYDDLWSKLLSFLTTNSTLVTNGEAWTVAWMHSGGYKSGVVLRGPGLAGQDEVLVGMRLVERPTPDEYEIQLVGMTGVLTSATAFNGHVNTSPRCVRMFVDSGPMTYWFVANGRRFMVVVKISTIFQAMYGGLMLPYGTPESYSYPLFIGGSAGENVGGNGPTSWRSVEANHRHFPHAHYDAASGTSSFREPSAWLLSPQGDWLRCAATGSDADVALAPRKFQAGLNIVEFANASGYGYASIRERLRAGFDGSLTLTPISLVQRAPTDQSYGILHGAFHVPGFGNSAENLVTVDGVNHLVVQDAFRTETGEFWAMALE